MGRYEKILRIMSKHGISVDNMIVVDCGCGDGAGAACLEEAGAILTAIDLEEEFVQKGTQDGLSDVRQGDLRKLDLPDNYCDLFFCSETLEHLDASDGRLAAQEIQRTIRPNGIVCITVPENREECLKKASHKNWVQLSDMEEWFEGCETVFVGQIIKSKKRPDRSTLVVILKIS